MTTANNVARHPRNYFVNCFIQNTDPVDDPTQIGYVKPGIGWVQVESDSAPWGDVLGEYIRNADDTGWLPKPGTPGSGGPGSGLDADTLDGMDSTEFATVDDLTNYALLTDLDAAIAALIAGAPGALDTLNELAAALADDAAFATTVTNALALKAPLANPTFTGDVVVPTPTADNEAANKEYVDDAVAAVVAGVSSFNGRTGAVVPVANDYAVADVNGLQAALDAKAALALTIEDVAGTTHTFATADTENKFKTFSNAGAVTATVPPNADDAIPIGRSIPFTQLGAGQVTIAAGSGVTIRTPETLKLAKQYSSGELIKIATNTWVLIGDLELV